MILPSILYEDVIRTLRQEISIQSQIDLDRIFNAVTVRGPDIYKMISGEQSVSFDLSDSFIVFEMLEDDNDENVVLMESDTSMTSISSFNFNLKIYGNTCHQVAQNILMRFKVEEVALGLRNKGIFIDGISFPTAINEFINNTVWPRCDMSINIKVRFSTDILNPSPYAESINGINIKDF